MRKLIWEFQDSGGNAGLGPSKLTIPAQLLLLEVVTEDEEWIVLYVFVQCLPASHVGLQASCVIIFNY